MEIHMLRYLINSLQVHRYRLKDSLAAGDRGQSSLEIAAIVGVVLAIAAGVLLVIKNKTDEKTNIIKEK